MNADYTPRPSYEPYVVAPSLSDVQSTIDFLCAQLLDLQNVGDVDGQFIELAFTALSQVETYLRIAERTPR